MSHKVFSFPHKPKTQGKRFSEQNHVWSPSKFLDNFLIIQKHDLQVLRLESSKSSKFSIYGWKLELKTCADVRNQDGLCPQRVIFYIKDGSIHQVPGQKPSRSSKSPVWYMFYPHFLKKEVHNRRQRTLPDSWRGRTSPTSPPYRSTRTQCSHRNQLPASSKSRSPQNWKANTTQTPRRKHVHSNSRNRSVTEMVS